MNWVNKKHDGCTGEGGGRFGQAQNVQKKLRKQTAVKFEPIEEIKATVDDLEEFSFVVGRQTCHKTNHPPRKKAGIFKEGDENETVRIGTGQSVR